MLQYTRSENNSAQFFFLLHRWILEHRSPGFRSPYLKVFIFEVLGIKPRASHILDKYSTTDEDWD